jgi:hypothetical protein
MMAGGGGASYFPTRPDRLQGLIKKTLEETEQKSLEVDVNEYLQQLLAKMNERDSERTQRYIEEIHGILGQELEIEKFLFGGLVAKHTFVDGLSDVDALVVMNKKELEGRSPHEVRKDFFDSLDAGLTRDKVTSLDQGTMAVTVRYADGTEIQLLPALRRGREICIADEAGTRWKSINPKAFHRELTRANTRLNSALIPTIKLAKSILSVLPEALRPTGYHVEALTLETTKGYRGPKTVKSILMHVLTAASSRVLSPIADITNQSVTVDAHLGKKNSDLREKLSLGIASIARRVNAASTLDRWKEIVER